MTVPATVCRRASRKCEPLCSPLDPGMIVAPVEPPDGFDKARLAAFVARTHEVAAADVPVEVHALRGGLMAAVARVVAQVPDGSGRLRSFAFVAKRLDGALRREA